MNISADTMNGPLLSTGYPQTAGVYDEMSAALGVLRPHWDIFINSLSALGNAANSGKRRYVQCLWRSVGNGSAMESGCHSPYDPAVGMEPTGSRLDPTR